MMTDAEVSKIAMRFLRSRLNKAGFQGATVTSEEDFDGGPIIRVVAQFGDERPPSDQLIEALHEIRSELLRKGEDRFVYLDTSYPQEQFADEDAE